MGSRLFSNISNMYGGRDFTNPKHRKELAEILDIEESLIPTRPSKPYNQIVDGIVDGKIKGLWVIATNPASSWIDQSNFLAGLKNLDFLVVQDMYTTTATAQYADLILPAAGNAEKKGTFINSERRISVLNSPVSPPGEALADFDIFLKVAEKWGCAELLKEWQTPEAVFEIIKRTSAGMVCDISGIRDYAMLDEKHGIQWPYPKENPDTASQRRLFGDAIFYHDDGKARFCFDPVAPVPEPVDEDYPLWLLTGRGTIFHWHTRTKTGKIEAFNRQYSSQPYILIHPDDAQQYDAEQEELVTVVSRHGKAEVQVRLSETMARGQVFISMHYQVTNQLTCPSFDPLSFQPSYKATAVRISKEGI
jgi:assimilatory nitrate reductase catalytic subunit